MMGLTNFNLKKESTDDDSENRMWSWYSPTVTANGEISNTVEAVINEAIP